eukprot:TRINITY_DN20999_c0_g1_i1.p1 TRINITY_DN20999_c0_g1~~TRINITY_DN20999_c0_g1_i1.p1  ORF type:complete len:112 (+),score=24.14 TRINITY_DN20999_c0_g1_i1:141-476(+)
MPKSNKNSPPLFHPYLNMRIQSETACERNLKKCDLKILSPVCQLEHPSPPCLPGYPDFYSLLLASCKTRNSAGEAERGENAGLELDLSKCSALLRRSVIIACRGKLGELEE